MDGTEYSSPGRGKKCMEYDRTHCFGYLSRRMMSRSHPVTGRTAFPQLSCKTLLPDTHGHPSPHRTHIPRCACGSQGAQHNASSAHSGSNRLRQFYPVNMDTTACSASANNVPTNECIPKKNRHVLLLVPEGRLNRPSATRRACTATIQ